MASMAETKVAGPTEPISSLTWSSKADHLVAGSWDKKAYCWDVKTYNAASFQVSPLAAQDFGAPILSCDFAGDGQRVFAGLTDNKAMMWQLGTTNVQQVGAHDQPVKCVKWVEAHNLLATGSWDKTVRYWDTRTPTAAMTVQLPERVYSMDVTGQLMTVACADQKVHVYNLQQPQTPHKSIKTMLNHQLRCVSNFPNQQGFAVGSIEGRVAIQHVMDADIVAKKDFAFKCHRSGNDLYAVNAIDFHKKSFTTRGADGKAKGTLGTCGSDGTYVFWDKDGKRKISGSSDQKQSITACKFNHHDTIFAYALSYDWCKGVAHYNQNAPNCVMLTSPKLK